MKKSILVIFAAIAAFTVSKGYCQVPDAGPGHCVAFCDAEDSQSAPTTRDDSWDEPVVNTPPPPVDPVTLLRNEGKQCREAGDYECALRKFEAVLKENPNDMAASVWLSEVKVGLKADSNNAGYVCLNNGDYACAIRNFNKALEYVPDDSEARRSLRRAEAYAKIQEANDLYESDNYAEAVGLYRQSLEKLPGDEKEEWIRWMIGNAEEALRLEQESQNKEQAYAQEQAYLPQRLDNLIAEFQPKEAKDVSDTGSARQNQGVNEGGGLQLMPVPGLKFEPFKQMKPQEVALAPRNDSPGETNKTVGAQLQSIVKHCMTAISSLGLGKAHEEAGMGFDRAGQKQEGLPVLNLKGMPLENKDPVVAKEFRTGAITEMEQQRLETRKELVVLREALERVKNEQGEDFLKAAVLEMRIDHGIKKIQTINLSIDADLKKAREIKEQKKERK